MENPIKMDDLGFFPIFLETPTLERMDFMQQFSLKYSSNL